MKNSFLLTFLLFSVFVFGQELPPILNYTPKDYNAANQNWMISQSNNHSIYIANNNGLLEFNGAQWNLYESPNETIIRSVRVINNKIYTGSYMEFGYWEPDITNRLSYTSLSDKIKDKLLEDEQFWNIIPYSNWIVFQSLHRLYVYNINSEEFNIITPENGIVNSFFVDNNILFQSANNEIFELVNGKPSLLIGKETLQNKKIINVFNTQSGLLLVTESNGLFFYSDNVLKGANLELNKKLSNYNIYSAIQLKNNSIALGTISKGLIVLSENLTIKHQIEQKNGLGNNTVLSIFEDNKNNLWLGLDNGVDCLNMQSPISTFFDGEGFLGTVYAAIVYKNNLYVGTNQGLFKKSEENSSFKLVPGTKGQVWTLFTYKDVLFCGHNLGTFLISNNSIKHISKLPGTWKFNVIPNQENLIIQGTYQGLSILEETSPGDWNFKNKIEGFNLSSKHFELKNDKEIYVSHEYKGVFKIILNKELNKVEDIFNITNLKKGKNVSLGKIENTIYYAGKEGVFKLSQQDSSFKKDSLLSTIFSNDTYYSGKIIVDNKTNKLWIFAKNNIYFISPGKLSSKPTLTAVPIPLSLRNTTAGYENIINLGDNKYLVGLANGYFTIDIDKIKYPAYPIKINEITHYDSGFENVYLPVNKTSNLAYSKNNISFKYSIPEFEKFLVPEYQYKLEGAKNRNNWSNWSTRSNVSFENLSFGSYTFSVRAKIGNKLSDVATYSFVINRPWYLSNTAIFLYSLALIILAVFVHKAYKRFYRRREEKLIQENKKQLEITKLENEQALMKIKNQQLKQDVESKNRELAASTMSLIHKNEILSQIKEELVKEGDIHKNIKAVIKKINKNTSEEDNWNFFEQAFNNADSNFLQKVKNRHPNLTPNDMRLCAYLRLNLSSKEIAPLLNISVRSVEIKRYRLRKKMNLSHETSLVEYILKI